MERSRRTPEAKAVLWEQGLSAVLQKMDAAGVPVAVIHPIPHFENFDVRTCPSFRLARGLHACGTSLTRQQVESQQRLARRAEAAAIATASRAVGVDFTNRICTETDCATHRASKLLYRDSHHLSVDAAKSLIGEFATLLGAAESRGLQL